MLDEVKPGWYRQINLRKLDLACSDKCVLGQVYGDFQTGGFELSGVYPNANPMAFIDSRENDKAWRHEIKRRRGERNDVNSG